MSLRVLIYGSCVTRDAVETWEPDQLTMIDYVARQSLISAMAPPSDPEDFRLSQIDSSFQRRMLRGDIQSSLLTVVDARRDDFDLLLWDLTDERNGVQAHPDGGWVTRLRNFEKEKLFRGELGRTVQLSDPEHSRLWNRALDAFLSALGERGLLDRLVINATSWAKTDDHGESFSPAEGESDALINRLTRSAIGAGVPAVKPAPEAVRGLVDHKWGRAPFHYVPDAYLSMTRDLTRRFC